MADNKDEVLGWLQFAIKLEKTGIKFYTKVYETVSDRNVKELFLFLIKSEKQHRDQFQKMLDAITEGNLKIVEKSVKAYQKIKQKPPIFKETDLVYMKQKSNSLMKMFNKAMNLELEGMMFYNGVMLKTEDPMLKALLKKISREELKHKQAIERMGFSMMGVASREAPI